MPPSDLEKPLGLGWERHREAQRRTWLRPSYAERLRWLEQAKRFAERALDSVRKRKGRSSDAGFC